MEDAFERYPHWRTSDRQGREIRKELYHVLLLTMAKDRKNTDVTLDPDEFAEIVDQILRVAEQAEKPA